MNIISSITITIEYCVFRLGGGKILITFLPPPTSLIQLLRSAPRNIANILEWNPENEIRVL